VYVVIFTFQAPVQYTKEDVSGNFWFIPSHQHYNRWESIGILCHYGDMSLAGHGKIEFFPDFFENYKSVTIRFKASGNETDVTFTAEGIDAGNQHMFIRDEEKAGVYHFTFNGGGMATSKTDIRNAALTDNNSAAKTATKYSTSLEEMISFSSND
jgi:hypothetical protein